MRGRTYSTTMNTGVPSYDHSHHYPVRHQLVCESKRTLLETRHSTTATTATAATTAATTATATATAAVVNMASVSTIFQSIWFSISAISCNGIENMDICMLYLEHIKG